MTAMFDLRRLFRRKHASGTCHLDAESECRSSQLGEGLASEYQGLIDSQFVRWGLSPQCVRVAVRSVGKRADGLDVFAGLITLTAWERDTALRLLLGLPLLDARIRRRVQATWLTEYSHFDGLWLHPAQNLVVAPELKELLISLTPARASGPGSPPDSGLASLYSDLPASSEVSTVKAPAYKRRPAPLAIP
jgi:hypothetical protein